MSIMKIAVRLTNAETNEWALTIGEENADGTSHFWHFWEIENPRDWELKDMRTGARGLAKMLKEHGARFETAVE